MNDNPLEWAIKEFERCKDWIQRAIDVGVGDTDIDLVRQKITDGTAQIWPSPNGVGVTKIETFETGKKVLLIWLSGGNLKEVLFVGKKAMVPFAKEHGCESIYVCGRRGWLRAAKEDGAKEVAAMMELPLWEI